MGASFESSRNGNIIPCWMSIRTKIYVSGAISAVGGCFLYLSRSCNALEALK